MNFGGNGGVQGGANSAAQAAGQAAAAARFRGNPFSQAFRDSLTNQTGEINR
jgi:hypothetical protein